MPKKGRIISLEPNPADPTTQLLRWEDLLTHSETAELIPADWHMGQIKAYIRGKLKDIRQVGEMVE